MLVIRLSRQGRSKRPFYRVVLTEHTKPALDSKMSSTIRESCKIALQVN